MSRYKIARTAALLVSFAGWLAVAWIAVTIVYSSFNVVYGAMLEVAMPRFLIVLAVGAFLGVFGSVARAIFDIAESQRNSISGVPPNSSLQPKPLRGSA